MPIEVLMPALSPTMTEGNLAKWHKAEGDTVTSGDVLAEIETDKATMEVEAVDEGTMGKILIDEGTEAVAVNTPIALLLGEDEDKAALDGYEPKGAPGGGDKAEKKEKDDGAGGDGKDAPAPKDDSGKAAAPKKSAGDVKATPLARRMAEQAGLDLGDLGATAPGGKVGKADVLAAAGGRGKTSASGSVDKGGRIFASPLARRLAKENDLDLETIKGSGPNGRIIEKDIERVKADGPDIKPEAGTDDAARPQDKAAAGEAPGREGAWEEVKHSGVRKIIAKRLTESDRDIPQIYLSVDCDLANLLAMRAQINDAAPKDKEGKPGYKVSVNDIVIKATAMALRAVPGCNARWTDDAMLMLNTVDVAVAVATDGGLITPIVFDADKKGLGQISKDMKDLAGRARQGKLQPEEYQGGSFSVSNLGMFGISHFTSIINPPQACILAVGAGEERAVVRNGEIKIANMMTVTLTCDHRVVDGAMGAEWLQAFKGFVENPATMLA